MTSYLRNIEINTLWEATEAIYNLLVDEGWEWIEGSPYDLPMVLAGKEVNSVRPYLRFNDPEGIGILLRMNGDALGDGTKLSMNCNWSIGSNHRLWMAADDEACCIYIRNQWGSGSAYHAGSLERIDPNDGWAWAVGMLTSSTFSGVYQVARGLSWPTYWQDSSPNRGIYTNIFTDPWSLNTNLLNAPILAPYFRFYGNDFRGIVKFAVSGLTGAPSGTEYEQRDPETNEVTKIYVCSGSGAFEVFST